MPIVIKSFLESLVVIKKIIRSDQLYKIYTYQKSEEFDKT